MQRNHSVGSETLNSNPATVGQVNKTEKDILTLIGHPEVIFHQRKVLKKCRNFNNLYNVIAMLKAKEKLNIVRIPNLVEFVNSYYNFSMQEIEKITEICELLDKKKYPSDDETKIIDIFLDLYWEQIQYRYSRTPTLNNQYSGTTIAELLDLSIAIYLTDSKDLYKEKRFKINKFEFLRGLKFLKDHDMDTNENIAKIAQAESMETLMKLCGIEKDAKKCLALLPSIFREQLEKISQQKSLSIATIINYLTINYSPKLDVDFQKHSKLIKNEHHLFIFLLMPDKERCSQAKLVRAFKEIDKLKEINYDFNTMSCNIGRKGEREALIFLIEKNLLSEFNAIQTERNFICKVNYLARLPEELLTKKIVDILKNQTQPSRFKSFIEAILSMHQNGMSISAIESEIPNLIQLNKGYRITGYAISIANLRQVNPDLSPQQTEVAMLLQNLNVDNDYSDIILNLEIPDMDAFRKFVNNKFWQSIFLSRVPCSLDNLRRMIASDYILTRPNITRMIRDTLENRTEWIAWNQNSYERLFQIVQNNLHNPAQIALEMDHFFTEQENAYHRRGREEADAHNQRLAELRQGIPANNMAHDATGQSTHTKSVHKSVSASAKALKKLYPLNSPDEIFSSIIEFAIQKNSEDSNNKKMTAAVKCLVRFQDPNKIKFTDPESDVSLHEIICLAWLAIHDKKLISATFEAAFDFFIEGLYEIQRGYNLNERNEDDKRSDRSICMPGSFNKIVEKLAGIHPSATIIFKTKSTATLKFVKLVEEASIKYFNDLSDVKAAAAAGPTEKARAYARIKEDGVSAIWSDIKEYVIAPFWEEFHDLFHGKLDRDYVSIIDSHQYIEISELEDFVKYEANKQSVSATASVPVASPASFSLHAEAENASSSRPTKKQNINNGASAASASAYFDDFSVYRGAAAAASSSSAYSYHDYGSSAASASGHYDDPSVHRGAGAAAASASGYYIPSVYRGAGAAASASASAYSYDDYDFSAAAAASATRKRPYEAYAYEDDYFSLGANAGLGFFSHNPIREEKEQEEKEISADADWNNFLNNDEKDCPALPVAENNAGNALLNSNNDVAPMDLDSDDDAPRRGPAHS